MDGERSTSGGGMSRLDLAKMAVEDIVRGLNKRVNEHNAYLQQHPDLHQSLRNIGLGFSPNDEFLLLSTGAQFSQQPATAACGAGGRLLVGFGDHSHNQANCNPSDQPMPHQSNVDSFQKQLKRLQATNWEPGMIGPNKKPIQFPEDGGGSIGLNTALSVGLRMLSRYRLTYRSTENYGMGRLPSPAVLNPSGGPATNALQPACLIVITDGVCLRCPPSEGGGALELQHGNMPLREFYQEPFRWDQRVFCLGVGGKDRVTSTQFLHPHLRALCEVTGGGHMLLRNTASLSQCTDLLLKQIAPPRVRDLPIPDPLKLQAKHLPLVGAMGTFVAGGPVCSFQALEGDLDSGQPPPRHRALLLYVPHEQAQSQNASTNGNGDNVFQSPTWCIPESFFPNKKLDTLPPRSAQPTLHFARFPTRLGSKSYEPVQIMKALHRLDQLVLSNRKVVSQVPRRGPSTTKLLCRDVYICEWIPTDGKYARGPISPANMEYFPVMVAGAARPSISEGGGNFLNIGILHVPSTTSTLGSSLSSGSRVSTLTLLPPEPHILLPLLIRAAEAEHRALKKVSAAESKDGGGAGNMNVLKKQALASRNVHLDEHWRNEFRAYLFQIPPYYQNALKWSLRSVLPTSVHSLLNADGVEGSLISQCFSKVCLQKIRNAEQASRENNERLDRQEAELRRRGSQNFDTPGRVGQQQTPSQPRAQNEQTNDSATNSPGYGQYDPRLSTESYLAALRNMPAPWRVSGCISKRKEAKGIASEKNDAALSDLPQSNSKNALAALGDLPSNCLMAYYESRRRWIFGGSGHTIRGIYVDGVPNDGSNAQRCGAIHDKMDEPLLALAGVGVSQLNATTTAKMGDYRERLLWSRAPVVGYGSNDCTGVSATTAANGAPRWSVDDDAMPMTFFNPRTGEFADSVQARVRARLMVNFGNPYKDKRADSLIPEMYLSQSPSHNQGQGVHGDAHPMTPPGSPPHDSYSASEGEGEAVFALPVARVRKSPSRGDMESAVVTPDPKRQKIEGDSPQSEPSALATTTSTAASPPSTPKRVLPLPPKTEKKESIPTMESSKPGPPPKAPTSNMPAPPPPGPPPSGAPPPKHRPPPPGSKAPPPPKPPPGPSKPSSKPGSTADRPPAPPSRPVTAPPVPPKPNKLAPPVQTASGSSQQATKKPPPPPPTMDMQSPDAKPNVDLPAGWMTVWSKSQQRWYFFNTKTNKSVWQWPPP